MPRLAQVRTKPAIETLQVNTDLLLASLQSEG